MAAPLQPEIPRHLLTEAAQWIARRDRGFSPVEQDQYLQWLRSNPLHAAAVTRHEATLLLMMRVAEWQPGQSAEPNPDLFAPPPRRRTLTRLATWALAAAAMFAAMWTIGLRWQPNATEVVTQRSHLRMNERQSLPDGSVVELKDGSYVALDFTAQERRVRLTGEAYFTVAKDAARPFLVEAGGATVRAVGTAFNVRIDPSALDVLVTEGIVEVHTATRTSESANDASRPPAAVPRVAARERMTIDLASSARAPVVPVSAESMREALLWQEPRFQFFETPLAAAIAEFNQHNEVKLVLAEPALGTIAISGRVRLRHVEGFVSLLELGLDLKATKRGAREIVIARSK